MSRKQAAKPKPNVLYINTPPSAGGNSDEQKQQQPPPLKPLEPVLVSPADVVADFESRPAPPKYYYYVTYVATLENLALPIFGAAETYTLEPKIEYAVQLQEMHERIKRTLSATTTRPVVSVVVTGWTFLRKQ
jgi:hypothetical protein